MNRQVRNSLLLLLTAVIWGFAFVAQSEGCAAIGPFSFNCIRNFIGSAVLLPVIFTLDRVLPENKKPKTKQDRKVLWTGGLLCGTALFVASSAQQIAIWMGAGAGKSGFLTACYILLVPILGLFLKKKCGGNIWIGVAIALVGLYLLCMTDGNFSLQASDLILLFCALCFSVQILLVDHYSPIVDGVRLASIQFLVCAVESILPMIFMEMKVTQNGFAAWADSLMTVTAWAAILYAGCLSSGVAYTLQIVAQNGLNPTLASLIMSLESVFATIGGALILHERMSARELGGCAMIFAAILLAQISWPPKFMRKTAKE